MTYEKLPKCSCACCCFNDKCPDHGNGSKADKHTGTKTRQSEEPRTVFAKYKCPPANNQLIPSYLDAAEKYKLDYRLLPAISVMESSCLKFYPPQTNNPWGWNSARTGFESLQSGIDFISERLANGKYYAGKTNYQKLRAYNPNPAYAERAERLIKEMSP